MQKVSPLQQNVRENKKKQVNNLQQQQQQPQSCASQATVGDPWRTVEDNGEGLNHAKMAMQELELQNRCLEKDSDDLHREVPSLLQKWFWHS